MKVITCKQNFEENGAVGFLILGRGKSSLKFKQESSALSLSLHFTRAQFFTSHATPRGCTQLPLARYRLHFILKNRKGNERQLHCLRFLRSSRQMD